MWGDWHISKYLEVNLPTLLAEGNFPALSVHCEITYYIYTAEMDLERIRSEPSIQALLYYMKLEFRLIGAEALVDPIAAHHAVWDEATEQAIRDDSYVLLMPPDVAWSNGSFAHIGRLLDAGKKAIFMTYLRAESESFASALKGYRQPDSNTISVTGSQLVEICLHTLHPLMAAYLRGSDHFPIHPEMMLWAVPNEGLLCRILAREMFIFNPSTMGLNGVKLLATNLDPRLIHVIADSDDLFAVSLAPISKELEWYRWPRAADPGVIGEWWLEYDSWINDIIAGTKLRWHFSSATEQTWRARERGADVFLRRAAAAREGRRLFHTARELTCTLAAAMIATAVQVGVMPHVARGRGGALVFLPVNRAFDDYPRAQIEPLFDVGGERDLARLMRRHFVPICAPVQALSLEACLGSLDSVDLSAADGATLRITRSTSGLEVNNARVLGGATLSGQNKVYLVERLLKPIVGSATMCTSVLGSVQYSAPQAAGSDRVATTPATGGFVPDRRQWNRRQRTGHDPIAR
ncbi:MAG: fasciclin domain-containing protein, partial [Betaproteobacteria bacterium]